MRYNWALANASTLSCFTSFHLESNEDIYTATDVGTMVRVPKKGNSTGNYQQRILIWGLFLLCAVDTETLWMACLHKSAVPPKDFLASNFLCLFYFFVSKLELFTRPPWEWQSNVDETKYPAFIDKTSRRE